jgi:hypothetical protein
MTINSATSSSSSSYYTPLADTAIAAQAERPAGSIPQDEFEELQDIVSDDLLMPDELKDFLQLYEKVSTSAAFYGTHVQAPFLCCTW